VKYHKLQAGRIRLVKFSATSTPQRPSLTLYENVDYTKIKFVAISYCWGKPKIDQPSVIVDGGTFTVRWNLHDVLRILQEHHPHTDAYFIDAICIDQADGKEKAEQIDQMGEVYSQADHVLGFATDRTIMEGNNTRVDMQTIQLVLQRQVEHNDRLRTLENGKRLSEQEKAAKEVRTMNMSKMLMQLSYFHRAWILLEVASARKVYLVSDQYKWDMGWLAALGNENIRPPAALDYRRNGYLQYTMQGFYGEPDQSLAKIVELLRSYPDTMTDNITNRIWSMMGHPMMRSLRSKHPFKSDLTLGPDELFLVFLEWLEDLPLPKRWYKHNFKGNSYAEMIWDFLRIALDVDVEARKFKKWVTSHKSWEYKPNNKRIAFSKKPGRYHL